MTMPFGENTWTEQQRNDALWLDPLLLDDALEATEAALRVGVTVEALWSLVRDRQLLCIVCDNQVFFPGFQFTEHGVVPHLREILPQLPFTWGLCGLIEFLTIRPMVLLHESDPVSLPVIEWLRLGARPQQVLDFLRRSSEEVA
ncbi:MAG TPA: hypothetical protein VLI05_01120 [Candidatus Saccharimonadia bacterium]|nr:hypothetical protein [Candidatus Saccharimonadia bacterium]